MSCEQIARNLADGAPLDDALKTHAKRCPPCGALVKVDHALGALPHESATIEPCAALREALARDHSPCRPRPRWHRVVLQAVVSALVAGAVLLIRPRTDLSLAATTGFWAMAVAWLALVAGGMWLLMARGALGLGVAARWRWLYIGGSVALFEGLVWLSNPWHTNSPGVVGSHTWWSHAPCAIGGSVTAIVLALPVFAISRRTAVVAPEAAGALGGLVAGLGSVLAMQMACEFADATHYGTIHLVPVALAVLAGALIGRRTMAL